MLIVTLILITWSHLLQDQILHPLTVCQLLFSPPSLAKGVFFFYKTTHNQLKLQFLSFYLSVIKQQLCLICSLFSPQTGQKGPERRTNSRISRRRWRALESPKKASPDGKLAPDAQIQDPSTCRIQTTKQTRNGSSDSAASWQTLRRTKLLQPTAPSFGTGQPAGETERGGVKEGRGEKQ